VTCQQPLDDGIEHLAEKKKAKPFIDQWIIKSCMLKGYIQEGNFVA
jgi:hypothetical protein